MRLIAVTLGICLLVATAHAETPYAALDDEAPRAPTSPRAETPSSALTPGAPSRLRIGLDANGNTVAFLEQRSRRPRVGLWATGLTLFVATPLVAGLAAGFSSSDDAGALYAGLAVVPGFGPAVNAGLTGGVRSFGWIAAGGVQAAGLAMFIIGLSGEEKIARRPVRIGMAPTTGGAMMSIDGKF